MVNKFTNSIKLSPFFPTSHTGDPMLAQFLTTPPVTVHLTLTQQGMGDKTTRLDPLLTTPPNTDTARHGGQDNKT